MQNNKISKKNIDLFNNLLFSDDNNDLNDDLNDHLNDDLNNNETCLIDGLKLQSNFITLECGHKFNYMSLYNEIYYQKTKKILDNARLKINEIKCPYCRNITHNLLPYFRYYNVECVKGINFPHSLSIKLNECQYIDKKNNKCTNNACITKFGIFCNKHCKYTKQEELILEKINNEFYKIYKKKTLKELKEELKNNKLKLAGIKDDLIKRLYINLNKLNIL